MLAPILFGIVIARMIYDAFKELDTGIQVNYRSDGGVFNLRRLQAKMKVSCMLVRELMFADDCALATHSEAQTLMDAFARSAERYGLTISRQKDRSACWAQTWCIIHHTEHPSESNCTQAMWKHSVSVKYSIQWLLYQCRNTCAHRQRSGCIWSTS